MKVKLIKRSAWGHAFILKLTVKGREHEIIAFMEVIERYLTDPSKATLDSLIMKG